MPNNLSEICMIAGWGATEKDYVDDYDYEGSPPLLVETNVSQVSTEDCDKVLESMCPRSELLIFDEKVMNQLEYRFF